MKASVAIALLEAVVLLQAVDIANAARFRGKPQARELYSHDGQPHAHQWYPNARHSWGLAQ